MTFIFTGLVIVKNTVNDKKKCFLGRWDIEFKKFAVVPTSTTFCK